MVKKTLVLIFFTFILLLPINGDVYADAGDFWDRNSEHFDEDKIAKDYIDLIKDYDYETNSFDCGWTDFYCKINGTMFTWVIGLVKASYSSGDSAIVQPNDIMKNAVFSEYKTALEVLSIWMLAIFLMWNIIKIIAERITDPEDGVIALNDKIVKLVALSVLLGLYNQIFEFIMKFQQYATEAVLDNPVDTEDVAVSIFINGGVYGVFIAMIIAGIMMIFTLAFMYRFILFGVLYITGVIAIPTGINDEYNYFSVWLRILITNGVTLFLQAMVFTIGVRAMFVQNAFNNGTAFVTGIACFLFALTIPSLLGGLGASSGTGRAIGSTARVLSRRIR